jgi:hypothetical protein
MSGWGGEQWLLAVNAVQGAATLMLGVAMLYLRSIFAGRKDLLELEGRVQGHAERLNLGDGRFARLEDRIAALPTAEALSQLNVQIERLSGDMRMLGSQLHGMEQLHKVLERQVGVIDDFLRERPP